VGVRQIAGGDADPGLGHRLQVAHIIFVEVEIRKHLGPARSVPQASQVDRLSVQEATFGQMLHGRGVSGKQNGPSRCSPPRTELLSSLVRCHKEDLDVSDPEPVKVLLPLARRQFVVHHDVPIRPQLVTPADNDLPMDQPLVHPVEDDRHLRARDRSRHDRLAARLHQSIHELRQGQVPVEDEVEQHGEVHPANDGAAL